MAYQLQADEPVERALRRVVLEQIDGGIEELSEKDVTHEAIHEARKRCKKVRAVLRLVKDDLGPVWRRENVWFRDIGRALSQVRDSEALVECLDGLVARSRHADGAGPYRDVRLALLERQRSLLDALGDLGSLAVTAAVALGEASSRVPRWPLGDAGRATVVGGVRDFYALGRRAMALAYEDPTPEHFHEWRKRVKDHWYHLRLLKPLSPPWMDARARSLEELSDLLGDEHDLVVLQQTVETEPEHFGDARARGALIALAERRRAALREEARPLGHRLYAERPKALKGFLEEHWRAWRALGG